jgi:hypothetical protein
MTIHRARAVSVAWGDITVDVDASGHINTEAGFGPWPAEERLLDELGERARAFLSAKGPRRNRSRPSGDVLADQLNAGRASVSDVIHQ